MHIQIRARFGNAILFEGEYASTKEAVLDAVKKHADLEGAYLRGADLRGADLRGADLGGAYLGGAYLRGAYLRGADLRGADLRGAYLGGADLRGADLRGADLGGADLGGEKLYIPPLQVLGLRWDVLITPCYMAIGCQRHTHAEWTSFDDDTINGMAGGGGGAAEWAKHKPFLLAMCAMHRAEAEVVAITQKEDTKP